MKLSNAVAHGREQMADPRHKTAHRPYAALSNFCLSSQGLNNFEGVSVKAFGVVNPAIAPRVAPRPTSFIPRNGAPYVPRTVGQSAPNLLPNYPVVARSLNPTVAAINTQRIPRMDGQEPITLDPTTRQNELRTLAAMRERRGFVDRQGNPLDPAMREQRAFGTDYRTPPPINARRHVTA